MSPIQFAAFDAAQHDIGLVADLIARSDEQINPLVYGRDPVGVISEMLRLGSNYFDGKYLSVVTLDNEIVGVAAGYPVRDKQHIDKVSSAAFAKAMGMLQVIRRIPFYKKLDAIMQGPMESDAYYVHTLSIHPQYQGRGLGTQIIAALTQQHRTLYLHVNPDKSRSYHFYEKMGFREQSGGCMMHKGKTLRQSLMVLDANA